MENESLANHTSFRIGGPAKYFASAENEQQLLEAVAWARENKADFKVIGGGSNILVSDKGFDGLIIRYFSPRAEISGETIDCPASAILAGVISKAMKNNLLGLEWGIGIPGTIGGAIHNNAGAFGGEMADCVEAVKILRGGEIIEQKKEECGFGYRESSFKTPENRDVIISARLKLRLAEAAEASAAEDKMRKNLAERMSKRAEGPSVGSTFRNIILNEDEIARVAKEHPELPAQYIEWKKIPAAWLIEECGLKGKKIGGAMVSNNHAGKITNVGGATAEDVVMLISIVKQKVRSQFNLQLMEEVEYIGF